MPTLDDHETPDNRIGLGRDLRIFHYIYLEFSPGTG